MTTHVGRYYFVVHTTQGAAPAARVSMCRRGWRWESVSNALQDATRPQTCSLAAPGGWLRYSQGRGHGVRTGVCESSTSRAVARMSSARPTVTPPERAGSVPPSHAGGATRVSAPLRHVRTRRQTRASRSSVDAGFDGEMSEMVSGVRSDRAFLGIWPEVAVGPRKRRGGCKYMAGACEASLADRRGEGHGATFRRPS